MSSRVRSFVAVVLTGFSTGLIAGVPEAAGAPLESVVAELQWSPTGSAGLITGDYQSSAEGTDSEIGESPSGSARVGFVTTFDGISPDPENGVPSPSPLVLFPDPDSLFEQTNGSKTTSTSFAGQAGDVLTLYFNYVSTDGLLYRDYAWARLVESGTDATAAWLFIAQSGNAPDGDGTSDYVHDKVLKLQIDPILADQDQDAVLNGGRPIVGMPAGSINVWAPLQEPDGQCWAKDPQTSSCGATGWVESVYELEAGGTYHLEFGVMNWGDENYQSALAFDFDGLAPGQFLPPITVYDVPEPRSAAALFAAVVGLTGLAQRRKPGAAALQGTSPGFEDDDAMRAASISRSSASIRTRSLCRARVAANRSS